MSRFIFTLRPQHTPTIVSTRECTWRTSKGVALPPLFAASSEMLTKNPDMVMSASLAVFRSLSSAIFNLTWVWPREFVVFGKGRGSGRKKLRVFQGGQGGNRAVVWRMFSIVHVRPMSYTRTPSLFLQLSSTCVRRGRGGRVYLTTATSYIIYCSFVRRTQEQKYKLQRVAHKQQQMYEGITQSIHLLHIVLVLLSHQLPNSPRPRREVLRLLLRQNAAAAVTAAACSAGGC